MTEQHRLRDSIVERSKSLHDAGHIDFCLGFGFRSLLRCGISSVSLERVSQHLGGKENNGHVIKQAACRYEIRYGVQGGNQVEEGTNGSCLLAPGDIRVLYEAPQHLHLVPYFHHGASIHGAEFPGNHRDVL